MTDVVDRYLRLGLRFGRLGDGLVDTYFGPAELAAAVVGEASPTPAGVAAEAGALLAELPDGWLRDQVLGIRTYAGVLAGEAYGFADEVEGCFGVRPERTDEAVFEAAHERLCDLLPGTGPPVDRYQRWRESLNVPPDRLEPLVTTAVELARGWTEEHLLALPPGEGVDVELVHGEPWSGFNEYRGDLRGRTFVNADIPRSAMDLLHLVLHETYPGHQAERALKDQLLVREQGRLEETLILATAPQAVISEGLAELAPSLVLAGEGGAAVAAGLDLDLPHALAVERAIEPLRWAEVNAAMLHFESGSGLDDVRAYLRRWRLADDESIDHFLRFIGAPGNRTYLAVYPAGRDLCRAYVDGDLTRFRRLLTEQVRVSDLR